MRNESTSPTTDGGLTCQASADSILDYGQYEILSTGNFLCSTPTLNSTMDFSIRSVEDGVVDSPPDRKPRLPVLFSPSPLRSREIRASSATASGRGTQKRLYGDANYPICSPVVKSLVQVEPRDKIVHVPVISPSLPHERASTQVGRLKRKLDGPSCIQSSARSWDSWERRSLQAQQWEHIRQVGWISKGGYSRGPEILMAREKLKTTSRS
jgi:hypothetical protein